MLTKIIKKFFSGKVIKGGKVRDFWQAMSGDDSLGRSTPIDFAKQVKQYKSWVYSCCSLIASVSASVPLRLYVKEGVDENGKRKYRELFEHPFLSVWENVNPWMNKYEMIENLSTFLSLTGNGYLYLVNNKLGVPAEFWVLPSQRVKIVVGGDFIKEYLYVREDGEILRFTSDQIVHFKTPNPLDLFYGYSTTYAAQQPIDHSTNMDKYESSLFRNMGRPDVGFVPDGELGEDEYKRLEVALEQKFGGVDNAGKSLILEGIKDVKTWTTTVSPREIAFLKGRTVVKEEIYSMFHIPLTFADPVHASRANMENDDMRLAKYAIKPHLVRIQEKLNEQVLPRYDEKLFCMFDIDSIIPINKELRIKERESNIRSGYSTRDQERAKDGEPPLANEVGSVIYVPVNTVAVKTLDDAPTADQYLGGKKKSNAASEEDFEEDVTKEAEKEAEGEENGEKEDKQFSKIVDVVTRQAIKTIKSNKHRK